MGRLDLRHGALALPGAVTLVLLAWRGRPPATGGGGLAFRALAATGAAGLVGLALAWGLGRRRPPPTQGADSAMAAAGGGVGAAALVPAPPSGAAVEVPPPSLGAEREAQSPSPAGGAQEVHSPPAAGAQEREPAAPAAGRAGDAVTVASAVAPAAVAAVEEVDDADILTFVEDDEARPIAVPLDAAPRAEPAEPAGPAVPSRVNLGLVLSQALATARFAPGVSVRRVGGGAAALADERLLRAALERLLRVAAAGMPGGGFLALRSSRQGEAVVLEIADSGTSLAPAPELVSARRLLALQGGTLERLVTPGRGSLSRLTLPAAPRP